MSNPSAIELGLEFSAIFDPNQPNRTPYETHRKVNPETNNSDPRNTRLLLLTSLIPEAYERYPGTNGITQGEKNETKPAIAATHIATKRLASKI